MQQRLPVEKASGYTAVTRMAEDHVLQQGHRDLEEAARRDGEPSVVLEAEDRTSTEALHAKRPPMSLGDGSGADGDPQVDLVGTMMDIERELKAHALQQAEQKAGRKLGPTDGKKGRKQHRAGTAWGDGGGGGNGDGDGDGGGGGVAVGSNSKSGKRKKRRKKVRPGADGGDDEAAAMDEAAAAAAQEAAAWRLQQLQQQSLQLQDID